MPAGGSGPEITTLFFRFDADPKAQAEPFSALNSVRLLIFLSGCDRSRAGWPDSLSLPG